MKASKRTLAYRLLQSKTLAVVLVIIAIVSIFRFSREVTLRVRFTKQVNDLKQQIISLQQQQNNLSSLIEYLGTDAYLESEARKKLSMRKPGEQLVVVPDANKPTGVLTENGETNFAQLWWQYFFQK